MELLKKPFFHITIIILLGLLAYSNTFHVPFHFDDRMNIVENMKIRNFNNFWPPSGSRWFGFLTFALNYHFGGLNTIGYHIVNLIIHIFNAILVYLFVILTFKTPYFKVHSSWLMANSNNEPATTSYEPTTMIAFFSALLFVAHPIQMQTVTYVVQRFTSLATMFYLLSLVMYIKARLSQPAEAEVKAKFFSTSTLTFYFLSLISAVLAMKTKEISFTLPVVIALYEFMFFDGKISKRILYLIPVLLTMLIIPLSLIGIDKPTGDVIGELREASQESPEIPRRIYFFTQVRVIVTYIRLLFLPINQNLDYDYPIYHSFFNPEVFLSVLFLLLIFAFGIYLLHRSRLKLQSSPPFNPPLVKEGYGEARIIAFGILWFFITLSVESSIIPIRDVIFEHRVYLPSIGAFITMTTSVVMFVNKIKGKSMRAEKVLMPVLAVLIILLAGTTYRRNIVWHDGITLWSDVIRKSPEKARPYNEIGGVYFNKGMLDKAISNFQIATRINPYFADAYFNLGIAYKNKNLLSAAIDMYIKSIGGNPNSYDAYNNIGVIYFELGHSDKAFENYTKAISLNPNFAEPYNNRGIIHYKAGQYDKAIEDYTKAIMLAPLFVEAYNNRGNAYDEKGQPDRAIEDYNNAITIDPNYPDSYFNRGITYTRLNKIDSAILDFQKACDMGSNKSCIALTRALEKR